MPEMTDFTFYQRQLYRRQELIKTLIFSVFLKLKFAVSQKISKILISLTTEFLLKISDSRAKLFKNSFLLTTYTYHQD